MTTDAITYCQKFLANLAEQEGEAIIVMNDAEIKEYKIACVRADYLQEVVDAACRIPELELKIHDYQIMVEKQAATIRALRNEI